MATRHLVLSQRQPSIEGTDPFRNLIGSLYQVPREHVRDLTPDAEFVYFDPESEGDGVYFGSGKIGGLAPDPQHHDRIFAEITDYKPFGEPVHAIPHGAKAYEGAKERKEPVRSLAPTTFKEICQRGGMRLSFVSDAHLMRVLGEHLITSEKVGILELVKNAYDAGASRCTVHIEGVPNLPDEQATTLFPELKRKGPVIAIWDDGTGIGEERLRDAWARPATIDKTHLKEQLRTALKAAEGRSESTEFDAVLKRVRAHGSGRIPLGEKGVGRFAAHRLGRFLWLRTRPAGSPFELDLRIDWEEFDRITADPRDLSGIYFAVRRQDPTWHQYSRDGSGTILVIYGGREGYDWDKAKLREIDLALTSFKSPTKGPGAFRIDYECSQLPLDERIKNPAEWDSPLELTAIVDPDGHADGEIYFRRPDILPLPLSNNKWKIDEDVWDERTAKDGTRRRPQCGEFYLRIRLWFRQKDWFSAPDYQMITGYLQDRGGVAIYRDGLGVIPANIIAERDWLHLTVRGRKKTDRLSYYNMLGEVELDQIKNLALTDTTSRESILETVPFQDLRRLVEGLIVRLENKYKDVRSQYNDLKADPIPDVETLQTETNFASKIIRKLTAEYDFEKDPIGLKEDLSATDAVASLSRLEKRLRAMPEWVERKNEGEQSLLETSGFAISISVSLHEITKVSSALYNRAARIESSLPKTSPLRKEVHEVSELADSLLSELRRLEPLRITRVESPTTFDLEDAIHSAFGIFSVKCRTLGIACRLPKTSGMLRIYGRYGAVSQVFANLFDNAIYWMERSNAPKEGHRLELIVDQEARTVLVADTGRGIAESIRPNLFQPFYSLKVPPSGLGLYITKHYMAQLRSTIRLASSVERLKDSCGAQFLLDFSRAPESPKK